MTLIDTSVWIAWLQGSESAATAALDRELLEANVCLAPVILQELLQGARNERDLKKLRREFGQLPMLETGQRIYQIAGELYARCRWRGVTIRSPHDCLIAALAVEHDVPLLTLDRDFVAITHVAPTLRLLEAGFS